MPTQVQFRRANTANTAAITGAIGELTVDTDKKVVVVHDGSTAGGNPMAPAGNPTFTGVLTVTGNTSLSNHLSVTNVAAFSNNVTIAGNLAISQQLTVTNAASFSNNVTISGNLIVTGTQTVVNTTILSVSDNIITLNSDVSGAPSEDAGIEVNRGTSANVALNWDEGDDAWTLTENGSDYYRVLSNNAPTVNTLTTSNTFNLGTTSNTANGFTRLSAGVIMQWGSVSANDSVGDITFANVFPNAVWSIQTTPEAATYDGTHATQVIASNTSTANVRTANQTAITVYYTAIGN